MVSDAAFQAAEAGLDDYTSKLLDDNQFYLHDVAVGESTRRSSGGTLVAPGASSPTAWAYGTTWTYPNGKDNWRSLTNGYEYNIQVTGADDHDQLGRHHRQRPEAGDDRPDPRDRGAAAAVRRSPTS